jgi:hypothetical protein
MEKSKPTPKPKYGQIRADGYVFTGYNQVKTKKHGLRSYEQWRSIEGMRKSQVHGPLLKRLGLQETTPVENDNLQSAHVVLAVLIGILLSLCVYGIIR